MSWASNYVGIPFVDRGRSRNGCDCWGLVRLVYQAELAIGLPDYGQEYLCTDELANISDLLDDVQTAGSWQMRDGPVQPFDVLVFRQGRYRCHLGLVIDARFMLHVAGEEHSKVESYASGMWSPRLPGAFFQKPLAAGGLK